jgi:hypothetical protein
MIAAELQFSKLENYGEVVADVSNVGNLGSPNLIRYGSRRPSDACGVSLDVHFAARLRR